MNRSLKKELYIDKEFDKLFAEHVSKFSHAPTKHPMYIKYRSSLILPKHLNYFFKLYNGKWYVPIYVTNEMLGHKFGEFVLTRKSNQKQVKKK